MGKIFLILLMFMGTMGCDLPSSFFRSGTGSKSEVSQSQVSSEAGGLSPGPTDQKKGSADLVPVLRANAQILQEIFQVALGRQTWSPLEFSLWLNALNQGASIEGVYNGLTHSAEYRELEKHFPGASSQALLVFGEELAFLEEQLPEPTSFDRNSAAPLAVIDFSGLEGSHSESSERSRGLPSDQEKSQSYPQPKIPPSVIVKTLARRYSKDFSGASIFTLKRVLGDEALKVVTFKMGKRPQLAQWYSNSVVRWARKHIEFGLNLRNTPDFDFHYRWAMESPEDRVKWEVLNRLHRILNRLNEIKTN